jgi:hypothetical protein
MAELKLLVVAFAECFPKQERNNYSDSDCNTGLVSDWGLVLFHKCATEEEAKHH